MLAAAQVLTGTELFRKPQRFWSCSRAASELVPIGPSGASSEAIDPCKLGPPSVSDSPMSPLVQVPSVIDWMHVHQVGQLRDPRRGG